MERNIIGLGILAFSLSMISSSAFADWATKVEDDVFTGGHTPMLAWVDKNATIKLDAHTQIRNNDFFGVFSDDHDSLILLLNQLNTVNNQLLVGVRHPENDEKMSFTFNTERSTAAVNKFTKACEMNLPTPAAPKN